MIDPFACPPAPALDELWQRLLALAAGRGDASDFGGASASLAEFVALYLPIAAPHHLPFVVAQLGQSLDGHIATKSGASHYVTGPESLVHLHRLRALVDAVVVGWRTAAADDPRLTVRRVEGKHPLRVVVDLEGRLPPELRMFAPDAPGALRLTAADVAPLAGVESVVVAADGGRCDPARVVEVLAERGCARILIEGGGALVSSFLRRGALDRLHLTVAPLITGEGRPGIVAPAVESLEDALRPPNRRVLMGEDVLFDLDLDLARRAAR